MLEQLTYATFEGKENSVFEAPTAEGMAPLEFTLVSCKPIEVKEQEDAPKPERAPFALTFSAPADVVFRQETVELKSELLGSEPQGIFLTAIGQSKDGKNLYQASFN